MTTDEKTEILLRGLPTFWIKNSGSNNYKFFKSIAGTINTLQTNVDGLKLSIQLTTATGTYLDNIGALFNLLRNSGESDTDYRNRIKGYWQNYNRGGLVSNIVNSFADALGISTTDITVDQTTTMVIRLTIDISANPSYDYSSSGFLNTLADGVKAAGTKVMFEFEIAYTGDNYSYDDSVSISSIGTDYYIRVEDDTYIIDSTDVLL